MKTTAAWFAAVRSFVPLAAQSPAVRTMTMDQELPTALSGFQEGPDRCKRELRLVCDGGSSPLPNNGQGEVRISGSHEPSSK